MSRIQKLNDIHRKLLLPTVVLAADATAFMANKDLSPLLRKVQDFDDFNEDNDPYGEHDYGSFQFMGEAWFFKFDYYDKEMEFHSPDPSNPKVTCRVLTIGMQSDY